MEIKLRGKGPYITPVVDCNRHERMRPFIGTGEKNVKREQRVDVDCYPGYANE
jgi:hypothetical protein